MKTFSDTVRVRNTKTGAVGVIKRYIFETPAFNPDGLLVEVDDTAKPYVADLYKSKYGAADLGIEADEAAEFDKTVEKFQEKEEN